MMKILLFAASLRKDSQNKKLIHIASTITTECGAETDLADFSEFDAPLYNGDLDSPTFKPPGIFHFCQRLSQVDGLILSSPEYNYSIPGTLKNLIDWVSRIRPMPWKGTRILLLSASPSLVGGNRALWQTRIPLECCGAFVFPHMFSLSLAQDAFDSQNTLKDTKLHSQLKKLIGDFLPFVDALRQPASLS